MPLTPLLLSSPLHLVRQVTGVTGLTTRFCPASATPQHLPHTGNHLNARSPQKCENRPIGRKSSNYLENIEVVEVTNRFRVDSVDAQLLESGSSVTIVVRITRPIASTMQWRLLAPVLLQRGIVEWPLLYPSQHLDLSQIYP